MFILKVHVSTFCSDPKYWILQELQVKYLFIIMKPGCDVPVKQHKAQKSLSENYTEIDR